MVEELILVIEPPREQVKSVEALYSIAAARENYDCDRFAVELQQSLGAKVSISECFLYELQDVPVNGYVIVFPSARLDILYEECDKQRRGELFSRLVILETVYKRPIDNPVWRSLEAYQPAAIIDANAYDGWQYKQRGLKLDWGYNGIFGLRSVARSMRSLKMWSWSQGRYCLVDIPESTGLVKVLCAYLKHYDKLLQVRGARSASPQSTGLSLETGIRGRFGRGLKALATLATQRFLLK